MNLVFVFLTTCIVFNMLLILFVLCMYPPSRARSCERRSWCRGALSGLARSQEEEQYGSSTCTGTEHPFSVSTNKPAWASRKIMGADAASPTAGAPHWNSHLELAWTERELRCQLVEGVSSGHAGAELDSSCLQAA